MRRSESEEHEEDYGEELGELEKDDDVLGSDVSGPRFMPVFTGIFDSSGSPIIRHPVLMKMGFHPEDSKFYSPTLEDNTNGEESVVGWVYDF